MDANRNKYVDGVLAGQSCIDGYETVESKYTKMYVMAYLRGSGINPYAFKVKSYRITRQGVVILDFIPVLDFDSVPCMYDKVSGQFFYNAGSGAFSYGPVIEGGG